jgi:Phosphodiester glycosidase
MARGHGPVQDIYKVYWKLGDPYAHLDANPLNPPDSAGQIPLGRISSWASWAAPSGFTAALNGDFFVDDWNGAGSPSGMLVHNRHVVAFGWGGPSAAFPSTGGMRIAAPRAVATKLTLPGPTIATIHVFIDPSKNVSNQLSGTGGDQVAVYTQQGVPLTVPTGYVGFVVGSTQVPTPFRTMLTGVQHVTNSRGVGEIAAGFHFSVAGASPTSVLLPFSAGTCGTYVCAQSTAVTLPLGSGESLLIAKAGNSAALGLTTLAQGSSHAVRVPLDASGWGNVTEVMGGKPQLVKNGLPMYATPWHNPPMMSSDCWQWCYQHWRPALAVSKQGYGWMIITGGASQTGVYGWDWSRMLVQLGAKDALGFDNNSSTEIDAPGTGIFSFMRGWQRDITDATSLSYHS